MTDVRENWSNSCRESLATVKMNYQVFCKRWIGGIGVYGYICVSRALRVKRVFILSRARSRVFPFSLVLIHRVHPYRSSQVIDEVQRTTCVILRTQPSYIFRGSDPPQLDLINVQSFVVSWPGH